MHGYRRRAVLALVYTPTMNIYGLSADDYESLQPTSDSVITRDEAQGYVLSVFPVSQESTTATRAATYDDDNGTYRISTVDAPEVVEELETVLSTLESESGVIGGLTRTPGDGYEVVAVTVADELTTGVESLEADSATYHVAADAEVIGLLDNVFQTLATVVSA